MGLVEESVRIEAPPAAVWAVLADYGGIAKWNPVLVGSRLVGTPNGGVGAIRHCDIRGGGYTRERVLTWTEGSSFTYEVYETDRPMKHAKNSFSVRAEGSGSVATFRLDYELKMGLFGKLMDALMAKGKMREAAAATLNGLKARAEAGAPGAQAKPAQGVAP